jgi:hypothetical protein
MADPLSSTTVRDQDRSMQDAELRQSFEAVCLFSALGVLLSLMFLLITGEPFDPGLEAFDPHMLG